MARALYLVGLLPILLVACGERGADVSQVPDLSGRWRAEFQLDDGAKKTVGNLMLASSPLTSERCKFRPEVCKAAVQGTHDVKFEPLLGHSIRFEVSGGPTDDGQILFLLGPCCDQGEVSVRGTLKNGQIRGVWEEVFISGGRAGTLVLTRES
jgi:hypothetical protein